MTDEKLGKILFMIGDKGLKGTEEFGNLDPRTTLEVLSGIIDVFTSMREHIVVAMAESIMGHDEDEDEDDAEGKLH